MSINLNNINGFGDNFYTQRISSNRANIASIQSQLDNKEKKIANIDRQIVKHEKSVEYINKENALIKKSMLEREKYIKLLKESRALGEERLNTLKESRALDQRKMDLLQEAIGKLQALIDKSDDRGAKNITKAPKLDIVIDNNFKNKTSVNTHKQLNISEVPVDAFKKKSDPIVIVVKSKNNIAEGNTKQDNSGIIDKNYRLNEERINYLKAKLPSEETGYFAKQSKLSNYVGTNTYPDFIYTKVISGYLNKLS